jgi:hypothetical protein
VSGHESAWNSAQSRRAARGLACAWLFAAPAHAQVPRLGLGASTVPGYFRVPVVAAAARGAAVAASAGYAFTESQSAAPGSHHRLIGRLGAGLVPLPWLELALGTNVRHDRHTGDELGSDTGTVLDSDVQALGGAELAGDLHLGTALAAHFSRGDDVGRSLAHPALDLQLLAAWLPEGSAFSVGLAAGYRIDRSGGLLAHPEGLRTGDRLALEVSDFDALSAGIGTSYRLSKTELLAELSGNVLVGAGAPAFRYSPLRAALGARQDLSPAVALRLSVESSLSSRESRADALGLYPIEPRLQVLVGVACHWLDWDAPAVSRGETPPDHSSPAPPAAPGSLQVNVTTVDGHPLSDAVVELASPGGTQLVPHEHFERYRLRDLKSSRYVLRVSAERLETFSRELQIEPGLAQVVDVRLAPAQPSGQIRGLIRSFDGQGLPARILVAPLGRELSTGPDGTFSVEVPPGHYAVSIDAPGHGRQVRSIDVQDDGVVILNADLRRAP